jgi:hypothetical protein
MPMPLALSALLLHNRPLYHIFTWTQDPMPLRYLVLLMECFKLGALSVLWLAFPSLTTMDDEWQYP